MIVPVGKKRVQINQGGFRNDTILGNDIFKKTAFGDPNLQLEPDEPKQNTNTALQDVTNQGTLGNRFKEEQEQPDLGAIGNNPNTIQPAGGPVRAQPTGTVQQGQEDPSQKPQFWAQLANTLTPFLKERNLRVMGNPKVVDKNKNVYELLLGPKIDPRTQQVMMLPDADLNQLYSDAQKIADAASGRIEGLPYIDEHQVWHIPLQVGGMKVTKA